MTNPSTFTYLRDPLFRVCVAIYFVNRFAESCGWSHWFTCGYLNDLICLPFWMPIMVLILRLLGLREHDWPPTGLECSIAFLTWATMFEVILPNTALFRGLTIADPNDVLAYAVGGMLSQAWWR